MIQQPATVAKERRPAGAVFVSHVADDARVALTIALGLENAGYSTWCFEVDSVPGVSYLVQIGEAIERASAVVLVISSLALHSRQVTIEVVRAHESDKPLLPVLVDVTHEQFQARQHEWRAALGAAASVNVPAGGPTAVVPRLVAGLRTLGVRGHATANDARKAIFERLLVELDGVGPRDPSPITGAPTPRSAASSRGMILLAAFAACAFGLLSLLWARGMSRQPPTPAVARPSAPDAIRTAPGAVAGSVGDNPKPAILRIGVMGVHARGDTPAWVTDATRDALNTILAKVREVEVFSRQKIDFVRDKRNLSEIEVAEALGMTKMISGTVSSVRSTVSLELQVVDIGSGLLVGAEHAEGSMDQLISLQNEVAIRILRAMGIVPSEEELDRIRDSRTTQMIDSYRLLTETLGAGTEDKKSGRPVPRARPHTHAWLGWPAAAWAEEADSDRAAILATLDQYRAALEAKDVERLGRIQELSEGQRTALSRYFANTGGLKVSISDVDLVIEGGEAVATFSRQDVFRDLPSGQEARLEVRISCLLARSPDGWHIRTVEKPS